MIKSKACPRCKGDLIIVKENKLQSEQCLQCGYLHETDGGVEMHYQSKDQTLRRKYG